MITSNTFNIFSDIKLLINLIVELIIEQDKIKGLKNIESLNDVRFDVAEVFVSYIITVNPIDMESAYKQRICRHEIIE